MIPETFTIVLVAEGTHTYCSRIKEQLESGSTIPLPEKHVDAW